MNIAKLLRTAFLWNTSGGCFYKYLANNPCNNEGDSFPWSILLATPKDSRVQKKLETLFIPQEKSSINK